MAAFAEVSDLEARWRPLSTAEDATAEVLLLDAASMIRAECPDLDDRLGADPPTLDPNIPLMISCAMVKRAMLAGTGSDAVSQTSQTAGPFSQQVTYANPMGNLYLTKAERKLLGCSQQKAFMVDMGPYEEPGTTPLNWWELNL